MSWVIALALALAAFVLIAWLTGWRRQGWEAVGAALLLGVAGYGLQASPGMPGAPKAAPESFAGDGGGMVEARKALSGRPGMPGNNMLVIADAFARRGQYGDAAELLRGALEKNPNDAEAWLALANALVGHADGTLSPAALYAFRRASAAAPDHPGPPFFLGMALAQSGRFAEARELWARLLAATPADAPWRDDLAERLARLDALIARMDASGQQR